MSEEIKETHPSYGLLQFNRVQGSPKNLFGTHLEAQHFIEMKLIKGERIIDKLGVARYYGHDNIVRVWMSTSQFSELITSMNIGMGIPCTVRQIGGENLPYPPHQCVPTEKIQEQFKIQMKKFGQKLREQIDSANNILDKPSPITKKDRNCLQQIWSTALQEIESNLPYWLEIFEESSIKIVTQAKTEFDSFVTHAATRIGLEHMANTQLQLKPKDDKQKG